jgi:hypothetical protein
VAGFFGDVETHRQFGKSLTVEELKHQIAIDSERAWIRETRLKRHLEYVKAKAISAGVKDVDPPPSKHPLDP